MCDTKYLPVDARKDVGKYVHDAMQMQIAQCNALSDAQSTIIVMQTREILIKGKSWLNKEIPGAQYRHVLSLA